MSTRQGHRRLRRVAFQLLCCISTMVGMRPIATDDTLPVLCSINRFVCSHRHYRLRVLLGPQELPIEFDELALLQEKPFYNSSTLNQWSEIHPCQHGVPPTGWRPWSPSRQYLAPVAAA
jgi:hypothetical protein